MKKEELKINIIKLLQAEKSKAQLSFIYQSFSHEPFFKQCLLEICSETTENFQSHVAWLITNTDTIDLNWEENEIIALYHLLCSTEHQGVHRSIMRTISKFPIPESIESELLDICFNWLMSLKEVACQVHAMEVAKKICLKYPELGQELRLILLDKTENSSAAFKSRASKTLKALDFK